MTPAFPVRLKVTQKCGLSVFLRRKKCRFTANRCVLEVRFTLFHLTPGPSAAERGEKKGSLCSPLSSRGAGGEVFSVQTVFTQPCIGHPEIVCFKKPKPRRSSPIASVQPGKCQNPTKYLVLHSTCHYFCIVRSEQLVCRGAQSRPTKFCQSGFVFILKC